MTIYLGMDVHSKQTVYVAQDGRGRMIAKGACPTREPELIKVASGLGAPGEVIVGLETGTQARFVSRLLTRQGFEAIVINAQEVRAKARRKRQKTDIRDAYEICDGLRRGIYDSLVYVPCEAVERLRRILSRRRHFVRQRTGQVNAAKFLLRMEGLSSQAGCLTTSAAWEGFLSKEAVLELSDHLRLHYASWSLANAHIMRLEKELVQALEPFKALSKRLQTVPGVGPIGSATFIAAVGHIERFESSGHLVSYLGLASSTYDSGERERHGGITKQGNRSARSVLVECAQHSSHPKNPLNPYFRRISAKGGYKKAVVAVSARLVRILYWMWRNEKDFDVGKLNIVRKHPGRSRVIYWELGQPAST